MELHSDCETDKTWGYPAAHTQGHAVLNAVIFTQCCDYDDAQKAGGGDELRTLTISACSLTWCAGGTGADDGQVSIISSSICGVNFTKMLCRKRDWW